MSDNEIIKPSQARLSAVEKRVRKTTEIFEFVAAVGRKSSKRNGLDPNDRHFDPLFSKRLRRMPPQDFDRLFRDDED